MKRIFDLLLAVLAILPAIGLIGGAALWILLVDRSQPVFRQRRIGRDRVEFHIWKLRTMLTTTPEAGTHDVSVASVTRSGTFFRRYKIDELPQLVNVIRGEMSFVGPRPGLPIQTELTAAREAKGVFQVRPGITGLAQINGVDMSTPNTLAALDAQYIALQSMMFDVRILWYTIIGRGFRDGVARDVDPLSTIHESPPTKQEPDA